MKIANSTLYNHLYRSNLTREPGELTRTYLNELDALIVNLAKQSKTSVQSIVCGAQGAFPSLVISRLKFLGLYGKLKHVLRVYNKNSLMNIIYLTQITNLKISNRNPIDYIKDYDNQEFRKTEESLLIKYDFEKEFKVNGMVTAVLYKKRN